MRDKAIAESVAFSDYRSPNDIEATSRGRERLWETWTKPPFKPGDVVAIIRPADLATNADNDARICLVHRFWCEQTERDRHLCFFHQVACYRQQGL